MTSSPETSPVVFFRSVSFIELESLVYYIHKERTQVKTKLKKALGVLMTEELK